MSQTRQGSLVANEINKKYMARKGRPKGQVSRRCLIDDPILAPYEIHVDEGMMNYMMVNKKNGKTEGYYASLPHLVRAIMRKRHVPHDGSRTYTLSEYVKGMTNLYNAMKDVLVPVYHK